MKTLASFCLLALLLVPAIPASANEANIVRVSTPQNPTRVYISNELPYTVRLYCVVPARGRYFIAEMHPGDVLCGDTPGSVPGRDWVVTTRSDERVSRFSLSQDDYSVVLQ